MNPAAVHDQDAVAHPEQLRQLRRDHDDPGATRRQAVHQVVNFDFRADVHSSRGLVEDEDAAGAGQPFPEHDLLLIAAAEQPHRLRRSRLHAQLVDDRRCHLRLTMTRQHAGWRETTAVRKRDVARNGQARDQPLRLPVFGKQSDPVGDRIGWVSESDCAAVDEDPALIEPISAGDDARQFGSPGAQQARDAEHFAGVQRKADIGEHAADADVVDPQQLGAARGA